MIWVETCTIEPPNNLTISGKFGASVMFVAYSRILDQWFWIYPGGEEKIAEPESIFIDADYAAAHKKAVRPHPKKRTRIRRQREEQLLLI